MILSRFAADGFSRPVIDTAELYDICVAQFYQLFRCLLTPITAAAVYQNQLIFIRQLRNVLCADGFVGNIMLKTAQGTVKTVLNMLAQEAHASFFSKMLLKI